MAKIKVARRLRARTGSRRKLLSELRKAQEAAAMYPALLDDLQEQLRVAKAEIEALNPRYVESLEVAREKLVKRIAGLEEIEPRIETAKNEALTWKASAESLGTENEKLRAAILQALDAMHAIATR